jgi:hypothetical protein
MYDNEFNEYEMDGACNTHVSDKEYIQVVWNPDEKTRLWISKDTNSTIEVLLETMFSTRSVSRGIK